MADAEQVYRAHPTWDEIADLHEETRKELTGSYEDAWLTGDE
jgi:hypothetical protein